MDDLKKTNDWAKLEHNGKKIMVHVDSFGLPSGEGDRYLRQFLGKCAKHEGYLPIGVEDWHAIDSESKGALWDEMIAVWIFIYVCFSQILKFIH